MRIILMIVMFALYFYLGYSYAMMHGVKAANIVEEIIETTEDEVIEEIEFNYSTDPNLDFYYDRDNK